MSPEEVVPNPVPEVLLPIIDGRCLPGIIIHLLPSWRVYNISILHTFTVNCLTDLSPIIILFYFIFATVLLLLLLISLTTDCYYS